ncbi:hypothetical protein HSHS1_13290 [Helicobacter suis HS1]|nr:hypothetical protein HSHS1_13290 [Helicobacter suis HS1]
MHEQSFISFVGGQGAKRLLDMLYKLAFNAKSNKIALDLTGFVPKTYSMTEECNILGLYDDTFIITKQENLVAIMSLQGLSYSNLMQKDLEGYFDTRQNVLNTISKDIQLRIVAKRRKEFINQSPNIDNPYAKAIITQFESKEIYKTEYFLVFDPNTTNTLTYKDLTNKDIPSNLCFYQTAIVKKNKQENENSSNETNSNTSSNKDKKNKFNKKTTFSATSKRALLIQTIERVKNIDFSQMDMKTQNKRKTMIELILDKKSIQIDEEFLDIKKHLEKFYSNKEQEPIAQTLENETEISCSYLWDKDFSLLEKHLENSLGHFTFESEFALLKDKETLNHLKIKQIGVLKVLTYEMIQTLKNQIIHLAQVVNEENLEKDEELVVYHLDFTLTKQSYKVMAQFCVK